MRSLGAVVVAAGSGSRFGGAEAGRKQYRELHGVPLVVRALTAFTEHPAIREVVVVLPPDDVTSPPRWLSELRLRTVAGGAERRDSVRMGIEALDPRLDLVLVHDGARPLVARELIDRIIQAANRCEGSAIVPGLRATDTLKEVADDGLVLGTVDRSRIWSVQTPQAFPAAVLRELHRRALAEGVAVTDDAALFEHYGRPVRVVEGDRDNLKVTTPYDLDLAELLARRLPAPKTDPAR